MTPGIRSATGFFPKVFAGCFILFVLLIVTIANRGEGDRWWSFIHSIPYGDKLGHVGLMGTLCLLCNLAATPRRYRFLPHYITRVTFVLLVIVTLEELSQAFIPTRNCDPLDSLADLVGLALGQFAATFIRRSFFRHSCKPLS